MANLTATLYPSVNDLPRAVHLGTIKKKAALARLKRSANPVARTGQGDEVQSAIVKGTKAAAFAFSL